MFSYIAIAALILLVTLVLIRAAVLRRQGVWKGMKRRTNYGLIWVWKE